MRAGNTYIIIIVHGILKCSLTSIVSIGQPGVEFSGQHKEEVQVTQIYFIPDQVRYFTGTSTNRFCKIFLILRS